MMHQQTRSGRISRPPLQQPAQSVFDLGMLLRASESASSPFSGMTNREMANIVASAARLAQAQQANAIQGAPHTPILPSIAMSGGQAATSRASQNDQAALTEMMTRSTRATAQRQTPGASSSSRADSSQQVAPTRTHRAEKRQSDHGHPYATPSPESGSDDSGGSDTETGYRDQQSGRKRRSRFEDDQDGDTRPARRPRRKYYKTKEESMEARKIRNRQTATKARERRQAEMLDMADKIKAMEEELAEMRQKHDKLAKEWVSAVGIRISLTSRPGIISFSELTQDALPPKTLRTHSMTQPSLASLSGLQRMPIPSTFQLPRQTMKRLIHGCFSKRSSLSMEDFPPATKKTTKTMPNSCHRPRVTSETRMMSQTTSRRLTTRAQSARLWLWPQAPMTTRSCPQTRRRLTRTARTIFTTLTTTSTTRTWKTKICSSPSRMSRSRMASSRRSKPCTSGICHRRTTCRSMIPRWCSALFSQRRVPCRRRTNHDVAHENLTTDDEHPFHGNLDMMS